MDLYSSNDGVYKVNLLLCCIKPREPLKFFFWRFKNVCDFLHDSCDRLEKKKVLVFFTI